MTEKKLLKNLHILASNVQPSKEWKGRLKSLILSQIQFQIESAPLLEERAGFFVKLKNWGNFFQILQPVAIASILLAFIGINSLGFALGKNSLPGEFLYNYKMINEKIVLTLIRSSERKISLKASFAGERLKELNQLAKKGETEKTFYLVNDFQTNLNEINTSFSQMKEKSQTDKLVKLAFILDAQTSDYENILNQTKKESNLSQTAKDEVKKVLAETDKTNSEALKVVVEKYENKEIEISQDKLVLRLKNKIGRAENILTEEGDLPILDEKIILAKKSLEEAKEYVDKGYFSMALEKMEESKRIVQDIDQENSGQNATSGKNIETENSLEIKTENKINTSTKETMKVESRSASPSAKTLGGERDFQIDLIKDNKRQDGFFGGLIKSKK